MKKKTFSINPRLGRTLMFLASLFVTFASPLTAQAEAVPTVTIAGSNEAPYGYATLADAVSAANDATSDVTVTLLDDVDLGETEVTFDNTNKVGSGADERTVKITLDLNGKTITGSAIHVVEIAEGADVAIIDGANSTTAGIINTGTSTSVIYNQGTLAVTGIAISGQDTGLNIGGGAAVVTNCNINGNGDYGILNKGYLTVSGGTVSGKRSGIESSHTATISGCIISGPIGITNDDELTIGTGVTIKDFTTCGISNSGNLTLNAVPTFTGATNAQWDIVLAADYNMYDDIPYHPYQPITFGTGLTKPTSPISVKVYDYDVNKEDYVEAALPYVFTQGYKTAFIDSESGIVDPADVFTVSGATVEMIAGEAIAKAEGTDIVAYNIDADGNFTGLYAKDGTTYTTDAAALTAAVTAANAATGDVTVTLLDDVDLGTTGIVFNNTNTVGSGADERPVKMTLDLNGKTITGSGNEAIDIAIDIAADTDVTIVSRAKGGKVSNDTYQCDGISNSGTLTVSGIDIYGSEIGIYNDGTLTVTDCNISGRHHSGIRNFGQVTVSGGSFYGSDYGIYSIYDVTLTAWPTFSGNKYDIVLRDGAKIVLDDGFAVPTTEFNKIKVFAVGDCPLTITSGYSTYCKDGQNNVIDPADVFTLASENNYALVLDGNEVVKMNPIIWKSLPVGLSTYYYNKALRVYDVDGNGEGVKMYVVTEVSNDKVTLKEISHRTIPAYTPVIISNNATEELKCLFEYAGNDNYNEEFETTFNGDLGTATLAKEFVGTVENLENYTPDNGATLYGFNGKAFVRLAAQSDIPANLCWLEIGGVSLHGAPTLKIVFDGDMTAIGDATRLNDKEQMINDSWYTLDGRKIEDGKSVNVKLPKGIYIKNGKKLIVR